MTSQISWLLIGGEDLRKIFGSVGKGSGIVGNLRQGFGIVGNLRQCKRKNSGEGWVGKARKKEGGVGWGKDKKSVEGGLGDDVIEKNEKIKNKIKK